MFPGWRVPEESSRTVMVRAECAQCSMTSTMVLTEASHLAWMDHMATHEDQEGYDAWVWEVLRLFPTEALFPGEEDV